MLPKRLAHPTKTLKMMDYHSDYIPVKGYEGVYEVNPLGSIRTPEGKTTYTERHGIRKWKQRTLKQKTDPRGYKRVTLWLNGKPKTWLVHRVVATTFIDNPHNYPIVNHINGIKDDNRVENLEWCDSNHNVNHAFDSGLMNCNKVILNTDGGQKLFRSMSEASTYLGYCSGYISYLKLKGVNTTKCGVSFEIVD